MTNKAPLRIAIDLTATPRSKTGIGRYMLGLLKGLQAVDKINEYYLFTQDDDLDGFGVFAPNFHVVPCNSKILRKQYIRILWEQVVFPWRLRKLNIDVLHCPNFTMPYPVRLVHPKMAVVGTFHDMTYFFLPEYHVGWKREFFKAYIKLTAPRADKIITISKNSANDIPKYCKPKNKDFAITYMGVKETFFEGEMATDEVLSKYKIEGEYIIYVGTLEPRKNIPGLIAGYSMLDKDIRDKYKLVIVGKKGWLYDEIYETIQKNPDIKDNIIFTGYVDDEDMIPLIKRARALAYVSHYEGFGIPVIEGMAAGVRVVTSYGSSLEEVSGGNAILCEPSNVDTIKSALNKALTESPEVANEAIAKAKEHARIFNWEACGEGSVKAYEDAVSFRESRKSKQN